ncbi:MAG TPA: hypothetical protein VGC65_07720 [Bacteroidia bacterium]
MNYKTLLHKSKVQWEKNPGNPIEEVSGKLFSSGAKWMYDQLNAQKHNEKEFNIAINYTFYGLLKYGICLTAFFISAMFFLNWNVYLLPFSIIVFYFFEVQFLFLFPLLIDNVKHPLLTSIRQTYKTGIIRSMANVIPIACYMLIGLFNLHNPLRNWHIGSLAIIIWYQHEIRNRL